MSTTESDEKFNIESSTFTFLGVLGFQSFCAVAKVRDEQTGKVLAIKVLKRPELDDDKSEWIETLNKNSKAIREVEFFKHCDHPHLVKVTTLYDNINQPNYMMPWTNMGNLRDFVENSIDNHGRRLGVLHATLRGRMLRQMLQAVDYLAANRFHHRHVKPENVLVHIEPGAGEGCRFLLADFGLCKYSKEKEAEAGTGTSGVRHRFAAPEVGLRGTPAILRQGEFKMDVWSLFAVLLWVIDGDGGGFRARQRAIEHCDFEARCRNVEMTAAAAATTGEDSDFVSRFRDMSISDALLRPSAAQLLVKHFGGDGLTTPLDEVRPYDYFCYERWLSTSEEDPLLRPVTTSHLHSS